MPRGRIFLGKKLGSSSSCSRPISAASSLMAPCAACTEVKHELSSPVSTASVSTASSLIHGFSCYFPKWKGSAGRGSPLAFCILRCSAELPGILCVYIGFNSLSNRSFGPNSSLKLDNTCISSEVQASRPKVQPQVITCRRFIACLLLPPP